jgi:hypothetical protein
MGEIMNFNEAMTLSIKEQLEEGSLKLGDNTPRDYLGASSLGDECSRKLWYSYHQPSSTGFTSRTKRIFELGNKIEDIIIDCLGNSNIKILAKQSSFMDGPLGGHCDGIVSNLPCSSKDHLLEIKSMNDNSFNGIKSKGLKKYSTGYWVQCQVYMHYLKMEKCLFISMNKNDCELYIERFDYNEATAIEYIERGKLICSLEYPPDRQYKYSNFFKCKMCNYNEKCWSDKC